ncbi:MAG: hypothetical protein DMG12_26470 [Acidobacteria bacterium]|nr:MAG: hypothetical protein DMG12_26470 [Acidobacteriota bacterium]
MKWHSESSLAGSIGRTVGWYREDEPFGFLASVIGAIVILAGYRFIVGRTAGTGGFRRVRPHVKVTPPVSSGQVSV